MFFHQCRPAAITLLLLQHSQHSLLQQLPFFVITQNTDGGTIDYRLDIQLVIQLLPLILETIQNLLWSMGRAQSQFVFFLLSELPISNWCVVVVEVLDAARTPGLDNPNARISTLSKCLRRHNSEALRQKTLRTERTLMMVHTKHRVQEIKPARRGQSIKGICSERRSQALE